MTPDAFRAALQADIDRLCAASAPPVPTRRRYTFAVTLEVPEPVDDDDVDGYTQADVEALMMRLLASYAAPLKCHPHAVADWELLEDALVEPVTPAPVTPARRLTRQEHLEGLADRGTDTWDEYHERT